MSKITKHDAILSLIPGAEVVWIEETDKIEWINPSKSPVTDEQIQNELERLISIEPIKATKANRAIAYQSESDPLFMKYQRGEATEGEWVAKVEEIKSRYPYT